MDFSERYIGVRMGSWSPVFDICQAAKQRDIDCNVVEVHADFRWADLQFESGWLVLHRIHLLKGEFSMDHCQRYMVVTRCRSNRLVRWPHGSIFNGFF